ncbi:MocR-like pyridoxine biosynthesis transcription factor PdxR [Mycolicibacterium elephantis]
MSSWANSRSRDLHLDLQEVITPGTRGARELLLSALRDAVRSGRLAPGSMLPPSRSLAADLGLARNTVAEAYAELVNEGWLASRQGAGTWVLNTGGADAPPRPRGSRTTPVHNLMPGTPDVSEFPRTEWSASTRRALSSAPTEAFRLGDARGRPELREALAEYLTRARGVRTTADSIVVCAGMRHAVELLGRVFRERGPIAVEAYGLFIFRDLFAELGVPTVPIGVDSRGAVVNELDSHSAAAVMLTPAHHSPFGMPLHPVRRTAAVNWAQRTGGYIFDDDYDGEFRYDRQPIGALQPLCPERVVYLGSASKSLSQALRLGWMVVPDSLIDAVTEAAGGQQFYVDVITQLTMADFISTGGYDKHIRRMRMRYRRRRDTLVEALSSFNVSISGLSAGVNLVLTLPQDTEHEVLRRAGEAGIALQGLAIMRHPLAGPSVPDYDGIIIGFAAPADHAFAPAVEAFLGVLTACGMAK